MIQIEPPLLNFAASKFKNNYPVKWMLMSIPFFHKESHYGKLYLQIYQLSKRHFIFTLINYITYTYHTIYTCTTML